MAKKIMLVEDDNNLREIYEARLSAEGYEIVAAENGEAALAMAAKVRPDMIISDVMMPKISGFEMLDILRNTDSLKNTKIIMLTALGQTEDNQRASSLGADRYLVKSQVTLEDIVKAAHDLLDDANSTATVTQPGSDSVITPDNPTEAEPAAPEAASAAPESTAVEAGTPEVAVAPASDPVPEPVADQPQTAEPAAEPAIAPAPQEVITPTSEPPAAATPADTPPSDAPTEPVTEVPTEPATAPSVISIPVSDGDDSAGPQDQSDQSVVPAPNEPADTPASDPTAVSTAASADATTNTAAADTSSESLPVVEPPAEPEAGGSLPVVEPPAETPPQATPEPPTAAADTEPATESSTPVAEPPAAAPDASVLAAQINDFLSQTAADSAAASAESPAPNSDAVSLEAPSAEPAAAVQTPQPTVEIPSIVAEPTVTSDEENSVPVAAQGPADDVPAPEQLDSFSAPVIDAPEGAAVPEPQDVPIESQAVPAATTAAEDNNADQLLAAAQDLAANATNEAATQTESATATNRMRSITPIAPDTSKPNIHQLLELEEAKNGAVQAAQATQSPQPNVDAYNPTVTPSQPAAAEEAPFDPNSISL